MGEYYNQDYSQEEIEAYLKKIHDCVREGSFTIAQNENRQENINFKNEFNINSRKQGEILLDIKVEDFCHSLQNSNVGFEHEVLYVFCPQVQLYNIYDIKEIVDIYIKFNLIEMYNRNRTIIVSFHKRNRSINYLYR
ncbi:MAG: hypothetical protein M0Q88_09120 [Bacilli bacterium]|nr:hypothetical protein [Bacilli bacterium]